MMLLTTLGCHDLSAMRDVFGMPKRCLIATRSRDDLPGDQGQGKGSFWWSIIFEYEGFKAYFEASILFYVRLLAMSISMG